jgi:2-enoate reductase
MAQHKELFTGIKIGKVAVKNRLALAPMGAFGLVDVHGCFNQRAIDYYVERAKGGTGLLISSVTKVENTVDSLIDGFLPCTDIDPARFVLTASEMTERVHAYGTKMFLQLSMGFGRVMAPALAKKPPVSASAIPNFWDPSVTCRAMTTDEVEFVIHKFGEAAAIAKRAGFDGVEIHAVHEGYLLDQFTTAFTNHRTDKYGGDLRGRATLPIAIVKEIKGKVGEDFPVVLRFSIKSCVKDFNSGGLEDEDYQEFGRDADEGYTLAPWFEEAGYDAFDADEGSYDAWYFAHPPVYQRHGLYLDYTKKLKEVVSRPVIVAGKNDIPTLAESALEDHKADMIVLGRALLADPYWPKKVLAGKEDQIRPCIGCHVGCMGRGFEGKHLSCAVNPACGRERFYRIEKISEPQHALVVGGGVAGMEAARVLSLRGFEVSLYEAGDRLGGNILPGSVPDFKADDRRLIAYYERQMELQKVDVHMGAKLTAKQIKDMNADVVILATGSTIRTLDVPCSDPGRMIDAVSVLEGAPVGKTIVMIGGGLVGCETALWLAQQGKEVTVVEVLPSLLSAGKPIPFMNKDMLLTMMKQHHIKEITNTSLLEVRDEGAVLIDRTFRTSTIPCDTVVTCTGFTANDQLFEELYGQIENLYNVGDSQVAADVMTAIWQANEVALNI